MARTWARQIVMIAKLRRLRASQQFALSKNAGTPIRSSPTGQSDAKAKLSSVNENFVVHRFVAKDSFPEFLPAKEALPSLGLQDALEIMPGADVEGFLTDKTQDCTFVQ